MVGSGARESNRSDKKRHRHAVLGLQLIYVKQICGHRLWWFV